MENINHIRKHWLFQLVASVFCLYLFAQLSFNISLSKLNIPITGQTLGVILVAYFCKNQIGILSILIYLLLGGVGLPFFADGASGWEKFIGGTGGYLFGFFLSSIAIYYLKKSFFKGKNWLSWLVNIIGTLIIVSSGVLWLTKLYGFEKALEYGFYPFWIGALVKILLGVLTINVYHKYFDQAKIQKL